MSTRSRYEQATRDLAFRVWRASGQNWTETERRLRHEHDLRKLTRQRLYDWAAADGWQDRAARMQVEEERAELAKMLGRETILADLLKQKRSYEQYLDSLPKGKLDNAAGQAYAQLCKTIMAVQDKVESGAGRSNLQLAGDVMRQLSAFVREQYPQHAPAFLEIIEPFGDKLVEIYG